MADFHRGGVAPPPGWPPAGAPQRPPPAGPPAGVVSPDQKDHLWEVLHGTPTNQATPRQRGRRDVSSPPLAPPAGLRRRGEPGVRSSSALPPAAYAQQLAPLPQNNNAGDQGGLNRPVQWLNDLKSNNLLQPLVLEKGSSPGEAVNWLERAENSRRWDAFEQNDSRFKEWVRREFDQLSGSVQQAKAVALDCPRQYQQQAEVFSNRASKVELQVQELQAAMAQVSARAEAAAQGGVANANMINASVQAALDGLRADLGRESSARVASTSDTTDQIKELHQVIAQINVRQEQEAAARQQLLDNRRQPTAVDPSTELMRSELDSLREELRRSSADAARRCEETASICAQRLAGVQDAALSAARELWEEHHTVVKDCKATLASLQQILDTKDKLAEQRQSVQDQQREDAKQELVMQLQQSVQSSVDALCKRLAGAEGAIATEQATRLEANRQSETMVGRLGRALEQAQEAWLKEAEKLSTDMKEIRRLTDCVFGDGEARRFTEIVDDLRRRLGEVEAKATAAKVSNCATEERLDGVARGMGEHLEVESRMRRVIEDLQKMHNAKVTQVEFDLRAALKSGMQSQSERIDAELTKITDSCENDRALLKDVLLENAREIENRLAMAREDLERHLTNSAELVARRLAVAIDAYRDQRLADELNECQQQMRSYTDSACERAIDKAAQGTRALEERLAEELKATRDASVEEARNLVEEERDARMKSDSEFHASISERLDSQEETIWEKIAELASDHENALATVRDRLDASLQEGLDSFDGRIAKIELSCSEIEPLRDEHRSAVQSFEQRFAQLEQTCAEMLPLHEEHRAAAGGLFGKLEGMRAQIAAAEQSIEAQAELWSQSQSEQDDAFKAEVASLQGTQLEGLQRVEALLAEKLEQAQADQKQAIDGLGEAVRAAETKVVSQGEAHDAQINELKNNQFNFAKEVQDDQKRFLEDAKGDKKKFLETAKEQLREAQVVAEAKFIEFKHDQKKETEDELLELREAQAAMEESRAEQNNAAQETLKEITSQIGQLEAAMKAEESRAQTAEDELRGRLDGQEALQTLASEVEQLKGAVEAEESRAQTAEDELRIRLDGQPLESLQQAIDDIRSSLAAQRAVQQEAIQAERARAAEVEESRAEQNKVAEETWNSFTSQLQQLSDAMKVEEARAKTAEEELRGRLDGQPVEPLQQAIAELRSALQAERSRATEAEESRAEQDKVAEATLKDLASQLEQLGAAMKSEEARAQAAEDELRLRLDGQPVESLSLAIDELRSALDSKCAEQVEALQAEISRAMEAEESKAEQDKVAEATLKDLASHLEQLGAAMKSEEARAQAAEDELRLRLDGQPVESLQLAIDELRSAFDSKCAEQVEALQAEISRATEAEAALGVKIEAQQVGALTKTVEELQQSTEARVQELRAQLEALRGENDKAMASLRNELGDAAQQTFKEELQREVKRLEEAQERAHGELREKVQDVEESHGKAAAEHVEQANQDAEALEARLTAVEKDKGVIQKALAELEAKSDAIATAAEDQPKIKDLESTTKAIDQKLGDLAKRLDGSAPKEALDRLKLQVDGGFDAMLLRLETMKWTQEAADLAADNINNAFLKLLDKSTVKLEERIHKVEQKVASTD